ncbi:hypothetical protein GFY24_16220 [Nocardia sp. SYP-A9097]|uniref:hypothetical protein n=1 Tax=Nocardia sp. SYP-A9097 TaxID=2663237 RepID=UPI00129B7A84|nr:hypothetical protein [Nocardia sp. SYP-A9097]MRH88972.1 hypothetical protein [Nocardia sp. SYP-A9097]
MEADPRDQTRIERVSARIAYLGDWRNLPPLEWSLGEEPADEFGIGILTEVVGTAPADHDPLTAELLTLDWADALGLAERPAVAGRREFARDCELADDMPVDRIRIWCGSVPVQDL